MKLPFRFGGLVGWLNGGAVEFEEMVGKPDGKAEEMLEEMVANPDGLEELCCVKGGKPVVWLSDAMGMTSE